MIKKPFEHFRLTSKSSFMQDGSSVKIKIKIICSSWANTQHLHNLKMAMFGCNPTGRK